MAIEPASGCLLVGGPSSGGSCRPALVEPWQPFAPQVLWPPAQPPSSNSGSWVRGNTALQMHFGLSHYIGTDVVEIFGAAELVRGPRGTGLVRAFMPGSRKLRLLRVNFIPMSAARQSVQPFMAACGICSYDTLFGVYRDTLSFRRSDIRLCRAEPNDNDTAPDHRSLQNLFTASLRYLRYALSSIRTEWSSSVICAKRLDRRDGRSYSIRSFAVDGTFEGQLDSQFRSGTSTVPSLDEATISRPVVTREGNRHSLDATRQLKGRPSEAASKHPPTESSVRQHKAQAFIPVPSTFVLSPPSFFWPPRFRPSTICSNFRSFILLRSRDCFPSVQSHDTGSNDERVRALRHSSVSRGFDEFSLPAAGLPSKHALRRSMKSEIPHESAILAVCRKGGEELSLRPRPGLRSDPNMDSFDFIQPRVSSIVVAYLSGDGKHVKRGSAFNSL